MVTDHALSLMLRDATQLERAVREHWQTAGVDEAEKDSALVVMRLAIPLRRSLEMWTLTRLQRAALKK